MDITYFINRGDIRPNCKLVENDVFGIVNRLQEIDKGYFVVFNPANQRYQLHHAEQPDNSYCLTFPYEELDDRAVEHTRRTSVTRAKTIFAEMKAHNERLERENANKVNDEVAWKAKEIYQHAMRHGVDGTFDDGAFTTKWS